MIGNVLYVELNMTGYGTRAMELAKSMGYSTHLLSRRPEEYRRLRPSPLSLADEVTEVDTYDIGKVMHVASDIAPSAVIAFDDYRLLQASILATHLGLPGPKPGGILNSRFKNLTRSRTNRSELGLPVECVLLPIDGAGDVSPLPYPCIVKPVDDSASVGVRICYDDNDYQTAVATAVDHTTHARGYRCVDAVLVEEFVEGPEFSAELLWDTVRSEWRLLGFTKTLMTDPPFRQESGHVFPWSLGEELDRYCRDTILDWLRLVGHEFGAAHVEFKVVGNRPALMEINPRLPGGDIRKLIERTMNIDVVDAYQKMHLGHEVAWPDQLECTGYAAMRSLIAPSKGTVVNILHPDAQLPNVEEVRILKDLATRPYVAPPAELAYAFSFASERDVALRAAQAHIDAMEVEYDSDGIADGVLLVPRRPVEEVV